MCILLVWTAFEDEGNVHSAGLDGFEDQGNGRSAGLRGSMVVVRPPQRVLQHSEEGRWLRPIWPGADVLEIWKVRTAESTRGRSGLHEADTLVHICRNTRRLTLIGAIVDGEVEVSGEDMELWQSPDELREQLSEGIVREVVREMKDQCASWSWTTAARALFMSAGSFSSEADDKEQLLEEITACWSADPMHRGWALLSLRARSCARRLGRGDMRAGG